MLYNQGYGVTVLWTLRLIQSLKGVYLIRITQKSPKEHFTVYAHRGNPMVAPENTLIAMKAAADAGAKMLEFDVQLSADNEVVVFHDDTLDRTTNGQGLLSEHALSQIIDLDAGSWFSDKFKGEQVPTLAQWLQKAVHLAIDLNIELKVTHPHQSKKLAEKVIEAVSLHWSVDMPTPLISSAHLDALLSLKHISSNQFPLAYVSDERLSIDEIKVLQAHGFYSVHHFYQCLDANYIALLHQHQLKVLAYTVNDLAIAQNLRKIGVNGIFTDNSALYSLAR